MLGNVWEWVEDSWHESYNGAPTDASAWLGGGDPNYRVIRGGSWRNESELVRSAVRFSRNINVRFDTLRLPESPERCAIELFWCLSPLPGRLFVLRTRRIVLGMV